MNDQEINIAIAEACGWTEIETAGLRRPWGFPSRPHNPPQRAFVPNYTTDLNAMHEAEGILNPHQCEAYEAWLMDFNASGGAPCKYYRWHATARQRAEAFLRTLGKWKEGK